MTCRVILAILAALLGAARASGQSADYRVEDMRTPDGVALEVGGMDFRADGALVMCTRRGDVWVHGPKDGEWRRFAAGLQEPLGLLCGPGAGEVFVLQRDELTRLVDETGDDRADEYETWARGWGYTGNYHEYAFGLARDADGNMYGALGLGYFPQHEPFKPRWCARGGVAWRGWAFKITPEREFVPLAPGCREPNGVALAPNGELFLTDNQGSYVAAGVLNHARPGDFLGHPEGLLDDARHPKAAGYDIARLDALRKRPAVYLPYPEMGLSCSQPCWDTTKGRFGPFAGDVLIGDINKPMILRATLEEVGGAYQGACYPFLQADGLGPGNNRLCFDAQGRLWVGRTGRGWASGAGLQRVTWKNTTSLALREMKLAHDGFELRFTRPVDPASVVDPKRFGLRSWRYDYTNVYRAARLEESQLAVRAVELADDRRSVRLRLAEPLVADRVYALECREVRGADGAKIAHRGVAYYTLNRLIAPR